MIENGAALDTSLHSRPYLFNEPISLQLGTRPTPLNLYCERITPPEMMAATKKFYPAPEDLELVSVLMNMKAGVPQHHSHSSPVSVLSPVNNRKMSSMPRRTLPRSISQSHRVKDRTKPPWSSSHPLAAVVVKQTRPIPQAKHVTTGKRVDFRDNIAQNPPAYTPEQRKKALERFKEKKRRRTSSHGQIRYQVRKRLADTRPRHRGRFFKPKLSETPIVSADQGKL